uniref:Butyrophilin subfamily 2 member A1-like n=1 Tax=Kryptolebias marmoratus TaxID=37003 RepID=A0A3Q2ZGV7_KRYMA
MSDLVLGFLLLMFSCKASSQEIAPSLIVRAMVGDDTVLPCHLKPPKDATQMTVDWGKPDLEPRFVFVRYVGKDHLVNQNLAYRGRTSLSADKLKDGDVSLRLSDVRHSDNGRYRCYIPKEKEYFVELLVGSASSAGISLAGLDEGSSGVVLDCKSTGWFPEPQLLWLDREGNVLPAGPPETSRGPDGLYSVSSRVTVEKRHNNNFTCRVQQKDINQSRETHVHVPDDFFVVRSNCSVPVSLTVVLCFILIVAVVVFVWKWRQRKVSTKKQPDNDNEEQRQLMAEIKDGLTEKRFKREEELLKINTKYEESLDQTTDAFMKIKDELEELKKEHSVLKQEEDNIIAETEKKIKEVEHEVKKMKEAEIYKKLKEIMTEQKWKLDEKNKKHEKLELNTDKIIQRTLGEVNRLKESKQRRESNKETEEQQLQQKETKGNI